MITPDYDLTTGNLSEFVPKTTEVEAPNTLGAAFRLENDVVNLVEYLSRPTFPEDPLFDFTEQAKKSALFQQNPDAFIGIKSAEEWQFEEAKLMKERADRQAIAAAGVPGIVAAMFAGVLSPTILLPVGGGIKAGGSVAKVAAETSAWVAFGAGVQEGVLQLNQDERTFTESAVNVGSAAVLGGVLGGAIRYATKGEMKKIVSDMADRQNRGAIYGLVPPEAQSLSAAVTPAELRGTAGKFADPGGMAPGIGIPSLLEAIKLDRIPGVKAIADFFRIGWIGPISRGLVSENSVARGVLGQFSGAGIYSDAAIGGTAVAKGGYIFELMKQHEGILGLTINEQYDLFKSYLTSTNQSAVKRYLPSGSYREFMTRVGDEVFNITNGVPTKDIPSEVTKTADAYINNVFKEEIKLAREVGIESWVQLRDTKYAMRIATQRIDASAVTKNRTAVRDIMIEHAIGVIKSRVKDEDFLNGVLGIVGKGAKTQTLDDAAEIETIATEIVDQILPTFLGEYSRHGGIDVLHHYGERASPFIYIDPTVTWANGRSWREFLDRDMERVARGFVRSMAGDIEVFRKFKTFTPHEIADKRVPFWEDFAKEQAKKADEIAKMKDGPAKEKAFVALSAQAKQFQTDLTTLVNRARKRHGMPADPSHWGFRAGKAALEINTLRLMGGTVVNSFSDPARIIMKAGVLNTFRHGILPMLDGFKQLKLSMREAKYAGTALDLLFHGRSQGMFDQFDDLNRGTMAERALEYGNSKFGIIAAIDYWNTFQKQFAASVWLGTLVDAIDARAAGTASRWQIAMLASHNIDESAAKKMQHLIRNGGGDEVKPGVWMPNTEAWSGVADEEIEAEAGRLLSEGFKPGKHDRSAEAGARRVAFSNLHKDRRESQRTFRAALAGLTEDTIVTPGPERSTWVDASTAGRLLAQFRSFTLSSTLKTMVGASQDVRLGRGAPVLLGSTFSVGLGMLSYYTWAQSVGGKTRERMEKELDALLNGDEEALRRFVDEGINRSGLIGVLSEVQKFGERVPALSNYTHFANAAPARSPFVNPIQDMLGPSAGIVKNLGQIVMSIDDPSSSIFRAVKQLLPFQNLMFVRQYFDALNDALMRASGVDPG